MIFSKFFKQNLESNDSGNKPMVIVGLGNPGKKYDHTRHNIGWEILDKLINEFSAPSLKEEKKFKSAITETKYKGKKILFVKPLTFMNLSGEACSKIKSFYKLDPEDFIIIYDDIDLPVGTIRYREKGGAGTHNGMRSLVQHFGQNFKRLRFGIEGRSEIQKQKFQLRDYVLGKFSKEEKDVVRNGITEALKKIMEVL